MNNNNNHHGNNTNYIIKMTNNSQDLGCGTGQHISFLKKHYQIHGLDVSSQFVEYCKNTQQVWYEKILILIMINNVRVVTKQ